jgi:hypothetical protein
MGSASELEYHLLLARDLRVPNKTPLCLDSRFRGNDEPPRVRAGGHPGFLLYGSEPVLLGILNVRGTHEEPSFIPNRAPWTEGCPYH